MSLMRACFRHSRVGLYDVWRAEPKMAEFLLYLKQPVLCSKCDVCNQEQALVDTINELRKRDND